MSDRAIDRHIKNLRRKLELAGTGDAAIAAVYGVGYRLEVDSSLFESKVCQSDAGIRRKILEKPIVFTAARLFRYNRGGPAVED